MIDLKRSSGIQLHLTSLPGGRIGPEAYRFVDWLAAAGQSWWQLLPIGPPDRYRSPYKSRSAFAAWPGLLGDPRAAVSKERELGFRERNAYWIEDWARFGGRGAIADQVRFDAEWGALRAYCEEREIRLLGDVAIYIAPGSADHRAHPELFQDGSVAGVPPDAFSSTGQLWGNPLYDWPAVRRRGYRWWIERTRRTLSLFDLARIDHFRGFVAYWAVPAGASNAIAGSWKRGPGRAVFDAIDRELSGRFREYGDTESGHRRMPGEDAGPKVWPSHIEVRGQSQAPSGAARMSSYSRKGPLRLPFVAEDLGRITVPVERLRDELGLPGMIVLQFGFEPDEPRSVHRPANHAEYRVVYTGTHDHNTARGFVESLDPARRALFEAELATRGIVETRQPWWGLIRLALSSPARVAMLQAQDVLGLGSEARMNDPTTASGNWRWRLEKGALTSALARRLRDATEEAGRLAA